MQKAFLEYDKDRSVPYTSRWHSGFSQECPVLRRSCWPALLGALDSDIAADAVHTSMLLCVAPCCTALQRVVLHCRAHWTERRWARSVTASTSAMATRESSRCSTLCVAWCTSCAAPCMLHLACRGAHRSARCASYLVACRMSHVSCRTLSGARCASYGALCMARGACPNGARRMVHGACRCKAYAVGEWSQAVAETLLLCSPRLTTTCNMLYSVATVARHAWPQLPPALGVAGLT